MPFHFLRWTQGRIFAAMNQLVVILDFGSQYTQLIARRLRELNVYCEIYPYNKFPSDREIKAVILSGSPFSVLEARALDFDLDLVLDRYPVLAVCYGAQLVSHKLGGTVLRSEIREYGKAVMFVTEPDPVFNDVDPATQVWMSHGDSITKVPEGFSIIAKSSDVIAAYRSDEGQYRYPVYCFQFHPEVTHSIAGREMLYNFIHIVAGVEASWTPASMVEDTVAQLKASLGDDHVMMGLSGGVDSTVAALLIHRVIGNRLHCFFIDNGLLRKDEFEEVLKSYEGMGLNVTGVRAADRFLDALAGVADPEQKRKIIGRLFIEVFEEESHRHPEVKWLGQGTIYPDVIESVSVHGPSVTIKSHHNVGGLPDKLKLKLVEPLRMLFKDEVRKVGTELSVPPGLLHRHPFPGPGLGIRVLGEVTREKVRLCQEADRIFTDNLCKSGWYEKVWQAGAILLPVQSVGVMGDERTYEYTVALRCVHSVDGMTAEWSHLPYELLATVSSEIINQVKGINRVVYDISTKPPATIEWE